MLRNNYGSCALYIDGEVTDLKNMLTYLTILDTSHSVLKEKEKRLCLSTCH